MATHSFRRRFNGVRPNTTGVLSNTLRNIGGIGIDRNIMSANDKKFSKTTEELDFYSPFFEEDANAKLREDSMKDVDDMLKYIDDNRELKNVVETFVDNCIVYDSQLNFCSLVLDKKRFNYSDDKEHMVNGLYSKTMKNLGFYGEQVAWKTFYEFAVAGKVAYEIIYKTESRKVVDERLAKARARLNLNESKLVTLDKDKTDLSESRSVIITDTISKIDLDKSLISLDERRKVMFNKVSKYGLEDLTSNPDAMLKDGLHFTKEEFDAMNDINGDDEKDESKKIPRVGLKPRIEGIDDQIPVGVVSMKRLNAFTVTRVDGIDDNGNSTPLWKCKDIRGHYYYLPEQSIVRCEWSNVSNDSLYSNSSMFLGMMRNYNLMRSLEESKVGWSILAGQFRLKMVVPTGAKLGIKAKEAVTKLVSQYKEKLTINSKTGIVEINGQKDYKFGANIALPSRTGNTTTIDSVSYNGVDMSKMDVVDYFRDAFYRDSNIPKSRYDSDKGAGALSFFSSDGIPYEELSFHKRCTRATVEFSKIIKMPMYYEAVLNDPSISMNDDFYNSISIKYQTDSYFELAKEYELTQAKMKAYSSYERIQDSNREPLFSQQWLMVNKLGIMTQDEWLENAKMVLAEKSK